MALRRQPSYKQSLDSDRVLKTITPAVRAPHHIGVKAIAADILTDPVDDQHVDIVKLKTGQLLLGCL